MYAGGHGERSTLLYVGCGVWGPSRHGLGAHTILDIYINDIMTDISSNIRLFADDSILYREINSADDAITLQRDLDTLHAWSTKWQNAL